MLRSIRSHLRSWGWRLVCPNCITVTQWQEDRRGNGEATLVAPTFSGYGNYQDSPLLLNIHYMLGPCAEHVTCTISFDPHHNPGREVLLLSVTVEETEAPCR